MTMSLKRLENERRVVYLYIHFSINHIIKIIGENRSSTLRENLAPRMTVKNKKERRNSGIAYSSQAVMPGELKWSFFKFKNNLDGHSSLGHL